MSPSFPNPIHASRLLAPRRTAACFVGRFLARLKVKIASLYGILDYIRKQGASKHCGGAVVFLWGRLLQVFAQKPSKTVSLHFRNSEYSSEHFMRLRMRSHRVV